jgi:hypothetical protein
MARDPNGPIPGFEDEYTGTVGHEKAIHKTHFLSPGVKLRKRMDPDDDKYHWVEVRPGRFKRYLKECDD